MHEPNVGIKLLLMKIKSVYHFSRNLSGYQQCKPGKFSALVSWPNLRG